MLAPDLQLGGGGKSAIGEFMRNMRQQNDNFEEQLLKLVGAAGSLQRRGPPLPGPPLPLFITADGWGCLPTFPSCRS